MDALRVWIPEVEVEMRGKNVTAALSPYLLSVSYTDYEEGQADQLDISLEDVDGRFRGAWYPSKGDTLRVRIGYAGATLLAPAAFEIDEIEGDGPPDVVTLRALGAGVLRPQRTHMGRAYENTTLAEIAQSVAVRLKLQLVGNIEPIHVRRVTQIHETDLTFLRRIAAEYGYAFSIKGSLLVFYKHAELHAAAPVLAIKRSDLSHYNFRDKIMEVVARSTVSYHDPKTKRLRHQTVADTDRGNEVSADTLKLNLRAESSEQASKKAAAALLKANSAATVMTGTIFGTPLLVAGVNYTLSDMGRLDGKWHTTMSRHTLDRSGGYRTDFESKRVGHGR